MLAGLAICTKQSIGVTLAVIIVLYNLIFIKNKEDIKQYIKNVLFRILGIIIPVFILLIYLLINGAFVDFMDYAVLGISTFTNKISYKTLFYQNISVKILAGLMPISIIIMFVTLFVKDWIDSKTKQQILTILIYSFSIILVIYPIADVMHFLMGSIIPIIGFIYIISLIGKVGYDKLQYNKKYKVYKILTLIIWIIIFAIILGTSLTNYYKYITEEKCMKLEHFKYIPLNKDEENSINEIVEFILEKQNEGKNVYILDAVAALYKIPANTYTKDYDMFLIGNLGKDGQEGQIEKIKNSNENTIYLIRRNEENLNWQTPKQVYQYVKQNMNKIDEIGAFDIYE